MDDLDRSQLDQLLRLTKENNHMLRSMRRNAWVGGIFKLVMWAAFILVPLWLYMQYLAPVVTGMMETVNQVQQMQGTGAKAQAQFTDMQNAFKKLQTQFPQYFQQE